MATFNRRLANGYCEYLGFIDEVRAFGIVDKVTLALALALALNPNPNP